MFRILIALWSLCALCGVQGATDEEIRTISAQIWEADDDRIDGDDVQYNINGPKLFTYVNEERFSTGTWPFFLALLDNYIPEVTVPESCDTPCRAEQEAFLDAILATRPIQLLHSWLVSQGLASSESAEFKSQLRQYWFMSYTRSGGPLGSSGFEHVFHGEIKNNGVSGSHNWANNYFNEKSGDFVYGSHLFLCQPEIPLYSSRWLGYNKALSSVFMRASAEVEIALGTLCLLTRIGPACPIRLGSADLSMTVWDMTGIPLTIGTSYSNCPGSGTAEEDLRTISAQIWEADDNRIDGDDVQYNINGPKLFTYVNEERFSTGTWPFFLALLDNYIPEVTIPETCGAICRAEEDAFLEAILSTRPIQLLQSWLVNKGLGSSDRNEFKSQLYQYWFMLYTRSSGPLGSSGFEHVFRGEIKSNAVSGSHNWANNYFDEKEGDFVYGTSLDFCEPEIPLFQCRWLGYNKAITSTFMRTSPEVEIALGTLCLLTKMGADCPIRLGSVDLSMTTWDMSGMPKTIGTSYPNC